MFKNNKFSFLLKIFFFALLVFLIDVQLESKNITKIDFWNVFHSIKLDNVIYLVFAIILMPINWLLESLKWKRLIRLVDSEFSLAEALKSVLIGLFSGFITPNRVGEFGGRLLNIKKGKRVLALNLSFFGGIAQFVITFLLGFSSFYFLDVNNFHIQLSKFLLLVLLFTTLVCYFNLKKILKFFFSFKILASFSEKYIFNFHISKTFSTKILILTILRYLIYVIQYVLMFYFLGIELNFIFLMKIISVMLLIQTILPSFALIDIGIRGNVLLFLLANYIDNQILIVVVVMLVWILNLVIPATVGYYNLINLKMEVQDEKFNDNNNDCFKH